MAFSDTLALTGNIHKEPALLPLKAGSLDAFLEEGNLRYISFAGREIIRMIYPAVRIEGWLTVSPTISAMHLEVLSDRFVVQYTADYLQNEVHFRAKYRIAGGTDGTIDFEMEGQALSTFRKNRIGFCVLHPLDGCAGQACLTGHSNGSTSQRQFPQIISPHQPIVDITSMEWKAYGEIPVLLRFAGDTFETEDHRNWIDASFKTYCTPLSLPYPVTVQAGEKIYQKVHLSVKGTEAEPTKRPNLLTEIRTGERMPLPAIGLGSSTRGSRLADGEVAVLHKLAISHLRADVYLFQPQWTEELEIAIADSARLGWPLEIALFFDEQPWQQANEFIQFCVGKKAAISHISILHRSVQATPDVLAETVLPLLRPAFPEVPLGTGTNANFAQLNRARPNMMADYIVYSAHPQEHAFDNRTLTENLAALAHTVHTSKAIFPERQIAVSPVTIQRRFNANLEDFEPPTAPSEVPSQVDARLLSLYGAGWIMGSIKYLAGAGASRITLLETIAERGVWQGFQASRWPERFPAEAGMVFPVFHVLRFVLSKRDARVEFTHDSQPLQTGSLCIHHSEGISYVLANYTSSGVSVKLPVSSKEAGVRRMNYATYAQLSTDTDWLLNTSVIRADLTKAISLQPHEVCFVDGVDA